MARKTREDYMSLIEKRMSKISHKLVVLSCKGGVGKSTFVANLATSLASRGYAVGVLDADLHGPCIPRMLGAEELRPSVSSGDTIIPPVGVLRIKAMSMAYLLPDSSAPLIWRGPLKAKFLLEILSMTEWEALDFLLVDCPPGTGDEPLSILQLVPDIDGAIIVTTPQSVASSVAQKAAVMVQKVGVRVLGIVENMCGFVCPNCGTVTYIFGKGGGEEVAKKLGVPFLGRIPIDPKVSEEADRGIPFVISHPDSPFSRAFLGIVDKLIELVGAPRMADKLQKENK